MNKANPNGVEFEMGVTLPYSADPKYPIKSRDLNVGFVNKRIVTCCSFSVTLPLWLRPSLVIPAIRLRTNFKSVKSIIFYICINNCFSGFLAKEFNKKTDLKKVSASFIVDFIVKLKQVSNL
jgi:hypothetical protein